MVNKKSINLVLSLFIITLLISFASAEIILENEPKEVYSIGDALSTSATIEVNQDTSGELNVDLICDGQEINLRKQPRYFISMNVHGGERDITTTSLISNDLVGSSQKNCLVKISFADMEPVTTNEFEISNKISMDIESNQTSFEPNSTAVFEGTATKANGEASEGVLEFQIKGNNNNTIIDKKTTINKSNFSIKASFPEDLAAGSYIAEFTAYETNDEGEKTNQGSAKEEITIEQVPSNLEIILGKEEVQAGKSININSVLHDQTGKRIETNSTITIRNGQQEIVKEIEKETGNSYSLNTSSNESMANWTVIAQSQGVTSQRTFSITENKEIDVKISGSRINITNKGNVPYNDTVDIQIGNETTEVNASLAVGESESYRLTAPDGEYKVTVYEGQEEKASTRTTLTGSSVGAKQGDAGRGIMSTFAWVFVVLVLGFVSYVYFQRTRNKTFFTREPTATNKHMKNPAKSQVTQQVQKPQEKSKHGLNAKNKAEVSLSISGDKQKTTAVCIHLKNLHEMEESKGYAEQTLQKIVYYAERHKAYTYEDNENLYFLLAPSKTKTFQNESIALNIAVTAKRTLQKHNKLFKKNIEYGISINSGEAIFKEEGQGGKFMSVSKLVPFSQKLAAQSKNAQATVLASKEVTDKLKSRIKADKFKDQDDVYQITGIKKYNDEDTQNFIKKFQERMEKEKHSSQNSGDKKKGSSKDNSKKQE
ncbi:MAG: hypothetical protein ABEI74_04935 [Candidatus Pacearchaeota archaeon]